MADNGPQLIEPVSESELEKIIRTAFGIDVSIVRYQQTSGGQFNTSYFIETSNPDMKTILRIAPSADKPLFSYERRMMLSEPCIYDMIRKSGTPMPQVIHIDGSRSVIDRDFMIIEYLDAVPMNHPSVPEDVKQSLAREVGKYTGRIHSIEGRIFGWLQPDGSIRGGDNWADVFGEILNEITRCALDAEVISNGDAWVILNKYNDHFSIFQSVGRPTLIHNDIWAPNILVNKTDGEWHVAALIDADRAMFADRELEFMFCDTSPGFLKGYGRGLDESDEAVLRRMFYQFFGILFCTWAYRVQIWKPQAYEGCYNEMLNQLQQIRSL